MFNESLFSKTVASLLLGTYLFVSLPFSVIAEERCSVVSSDLIEEKVSKTISSSGGFLTLGSASIEIPEGALRGDKTIQIERLSRVADTGESLSNTIPKAKGYRFLPSGSVFEKSVIITLPYDRVLNAKPQVLEELYTYFYDTKKKQWVRLERLEVDTDSCVVRSLTTHFTDMITATLTLPETADPVDVNLNSIKNLSSATPDSHLVRFNQPQASNRGDANFSFDLAVPAGRKGMEPSLRVLYSSDGGQGIMGSGFDVQYGSSITTDTRFGLPQYDTYDRYMLDGTVLTETNRTGDTIYYRSERESSFSRIVRYGAGTDHDRWEVTDKSGRKSIFGLDVSSCVGNGRQKFTWNISKIVDVRGNTVEFTYSKEEGYVYPEAIYYTGYGEERGNYRVQFHYDIEDSVGRKDIRVEARSRSLVSCSKLLSRITSHYKSETIRTYKFIYKEGLAQKKMLTHFVVFNNAGEYYEYSFDYTEPNMTAGGKIEYFSDVMEWKGEKPLHVGTGSNVGTSFNGAAGVGFGSSYIDGRVTGGGSTSSSSGRSYTEATLIDIDGDGRLDSVRQDGENLYVSLGNGFGFGDEKRITINDFTTKLDYEANDSSSTGWNVYGGVGSKVNISAGASYAEVSQKSSSTTKCSFMDVNRDGLVDIVVSGKKTYFRNTGNLTFVSTPLSIEVEIGDVVQKISKKDAEEYAKAYFVQTPFRMWRAPYEGRVNIAEVARYTAANRGEGVKIHTYFSEQDSQNFTLDVPCEKEQTGFTIKKDEAVYFISDTGEEPKDLDIDWDITLTYSHVKALQPAVKTPLFVYESFKNINVTIERTTSTSNEDITESDVDAIQNKFNNTYNPLYFSLYTIIKSKPTKKNKDDSSYQYRLSLSYNENWEGKVTDAMRQAIYAQLLADGHILPRAYPKEAFELLCNAVREEKTEWDEVSDFARYFEYKLSDDVFVFINDDDKDLIEFYNDYGLFFTSDIKDKALQLLNVDGITRTISPSKITYSRFESEDFSKEGRSKESIGSVYSDAEIKTHFLNIGTLVGVDGREQKITYNFTTKQVLVDGKVDSRVKLKPHGALESPPSTFDLEVYKDSSGEVACELSVRCSEINSRATYIYQEEMDKLVSEYDVPYVDIHDEYWHWDGETEKVQDPEAKITSAIGLSAEEIEAFIASMYELRTVYKEVEGDPLLDEEGNQVFDEEGNEVFELIEVVDYTYYIIQDTPNYGEAQKLLSAYKYRHVTEDLFLFYTQSDNGYRLKDFWKTEKTQSEIFQMDIDALVSVLKVDVDSLPKKPIRKKKALYNIYCEKNALLLSKCQTYRFETYHSISYSVVYNTEYLYAIDDSSKYTLPILGKEGRLVEEVRPLALGRHLWNTEADYSVENMNLPFEVGTYFVSSGEYPELVELEDEAVAIGTGEVLYGGNKNWYYGVWKGTLTEHPFEKDVFGRV